MYRRSLILRHSNLPSRCINIIRNYSNSQPSDNKYKDYDFIIEENRSPQDIVKNYLSPEQIEGHIESEGVLPPQEMSPFRNPDGTFIKGKNSAEARLDDRTLEGKIDHSITELPHRIAKTIQNNIIKLSIPARLRTRVAHIYQNLQKKSNSTSSINTFGL